MTTIANTVDGRSARTTNGFIRTHPLLTYFALAFAISWGGVMLVVGPGGIPGTTEQFETLFPAVYLAMLAGPSIAGILLTGLVDGKPGFRELVSRLLKWRVRARWYAVAVLTAPILTTVVLAALSLRSREFLPGILTADDKASRLVFGIAVALGAGFFEELGWTGFAVPRLRRRYGVLTTGLTLGLLWGAWHFLVQLWGSAGSGSFALWLLIPVELFSFLPGYRVLMVWVYERTGSLAVAMLMHACLTGCAVLLAPVSTSGETLMTYDLALAAALWVVVAGVGLANRGHLSPRPLRTEMA
jgi:membrane protease YdiL (CAAX protease family)